MNNFQFPPEPYKALLVQTSAREWLVCEFNGTHLIAGSTGAIPVPPETKPKPTWRWVYLLDILKDGIS